MVMELVDPTATDEAARLLGPAGSAIQVVLSVTPGAHVLPHALPDLTKQLYDV
jgi:hypothetical protein